MAEQKKYYSINKAADLLGVARRNIKKAVETGDLETITVGKRLKITADSLTAWKTRVFLEGAVFLKASADSNPTVDNLLDLKSNIDKPGISASANDASVIIRRAENEQRKVDYSALISDLAGVFMPEEEARILWHAISQHQKDLKVLLNRVVDIKVALLDYLSIHPVSDIDLRLISINVYKKLTDNALYDGLTGLYSRAVFIEYLKKEWDYFSRTTSAFSLILCDIDHFKDINDSFGHETGDKVLMEVAEKIYRQCRKYDICARYGGEEFIILMPDTDKDASEAFCRRIQKSIKILQAEELKNRAVTMSFGIAFSKNAFDPEHLIRIADMNMYRAKNEGRNRVIA